MTINHTVRPAIVAILLAAILVTLSACSSRPVYPPGATVTYATLTPNAKAVRNLQRDFIHAMMENDEIVLRSITSQKAVPKAEMWLAEHEAVKCGFSFDPEDRLSRDGPDFAFSGESWSGRLFFLRACPAKNPPRAVYSTKLEYVSIQRIDGHWKVVDWGKVTEEWF